MTLAALMYEAKNLSMQFSSAAIPIKYEGEDVEIMLVPAEDEKEGYIINLYIEKK